jgi:probable F420-dependent oxidoreductase
MKIGVVFPRTAIGADPVAIKDFAQAAEALGYSHITIEEHVLGVDPNREGGWHYGPTGSTRLGGYITKDAPFNEPFVLSGYLAALTTRVELVTGVLILPQRQAALVAKQATEVANLSGGRLRLGVGVGWNPVEFEGMGVDFHTRGRRQEEQIDLMRRLWRHEVVDFRGRWHRVDRAGLNPQPKHPIPIWFGGNSEATLKRAARMGDGWIPLGLQPGDQAAAILGRLRGYLLEAGRDPATFGIDVSAQATTGDAVAWRGHIERWRELGATHITVRVTQPGSGGPGAHIDALRRYREAISA